MAGSNNPLCSAAFLGELQQALKATKPQESAKPYEHPAKVERKPAPRLTLTTRNGRRCSYPYSYIGLIDCPSPESLIIHCNSREIERIEVKGRCLDQVGAMVAAQELAVLSESENTTFISQNTVFVREIVLHLAKAR